MLDKQLENNYIIIINNMTFEWDNETVIRIISARKATKNETKEYAKHLA